VINSLGADNRYIIVTNRYNQDMKPKPRARTKIPSQEGCQRGIVSTTGTAIKYSQEVQPRGKSKRWANRGKSLGTFNRYITAGNRYNQDMMQKPRARKKITSRKRWPRGIVLAT
jgi:hypothetical protein